MDVKGAYLNADMKSPKDRKTYIKLNKDITKIYLEVHPDARKLVNGDGTLFVRADKAMYGCIQSGFLWQEALEKVLIKLGFKICSYDRCVARSIDGDVIVCYHVDDLLISARTNKLRDKFIADMQNEFKCTVKKGNSLDYLGMHIDVVPGQYIDISQLSMVEKLVKDVKGQAATPAASVFTEPTVEEQIRNMQALNAEESALYRSIVASCLYLSKRSRPDWLYAVNSLCRHAQSPTLGDKIALGRLLKYANKTKSKKLRLKCEELELKVYIDASFANNEDRKSTSGVVIMLGGAVLWAKSAKQNIISKSSTEAELIALSDMTSMALWMSLLINDLGFKIGPPIIFQDNQSTMTVATRGLTTNTSTRHIDIRRLWIKEKISCGDIILKYLPTNDMVADGFTKPLSGAMFMKFVADLNIV